MERKIFLFIILIFLSCNNKKKNIGDSTLKVSKIDTSRVKIFKYDSNDKYCQRVFKSGQNSNLVDKDLIKIENSIDLIIRRQNPHQIETFKEISKIRPKEKFELNDFIIDKKKYVRKYLVITNSKNEKLVYVNLICNEIANHFEWKNYLSEGYGGGSCIFSFKLNLTTNKYYDVYFHAEA